MGVTGVDQIFRVRLNVELVWLLREPGEGINSVCYV
jgi:hypothetical protein